MPLAPYAPSTPKRILHVGFLSWICILHYGCQACSLHYFGYTYWYEVPQKISALNFRRHSVEVVLTGVAAKQYPCQGCVMLGHTTQAEWFLGYLLPGLTKFVSLSIIPSQNTLNFNQLTTNKNLHLTSVKLNQAWCKQCWKLSCILFKIFLKKWKFSWQFSVGQNLMYFVME